VSREDNARAVVAKVALGEGDAALVYATDARATPDVAMIEVPRATNVAAIYAGVVIGATAHPEAAAAFLAWLAGADGQTILGRHGFGPPGAG
jgi:molybdate transport system substrate-binding protein